MPELTFKAKMLVSETYQTNLIYFLLAMIYLILSLVLPTGRRAPNAVSKSSRRIEMGYGELWDATHVELLAAAWATLQLAFGALVIGLIVGLLVALARLSGNRALRRAALYYIELFRGTPALVQLFIVYFSLTEIGVHFSSFQAAMIGLGLNAAAYLARDIPAGASRPCPKGRWKRRKRLAWHATTCCAGSCCPRPSASCWRPLATSRSRC